MHYYYKYIQNWYVFLIGKLPRPSIFTSSCFQVSAGCQLCRFLSRNQSQPRKKCFLLQRKLHLNRSSKMLELSMWKGPLVSHIHKNFLDLFTKNLGSCSCSYDFFGITKSPLTTLNPTNLEDLHRLVANLWRSREDGDFVFHVCGGTLRQRIHGVTPVGDDTGCLASDQHGSQHKRFV